jgi:enamine deaminase RidA (YjgF/YER057c/UK114 family)
LLDGKCATTACNHRFAQPGERTNGEVAHNIPPCLLGLQHHTVVAYDGIRRVALMVTAESGGDFRDQVWEVMSTMRAILRQQQEPMVLTTQTVFIDDPANVPLARRMFEAYYGERMPLTLFVVQPPCDGRGIAVEAWAISTRTVKVEHRGPSLVTVEHDGLHWIHAGSGAFCDGHHTAYEQTADVFEGLRAKLAEAGASFRDVVRVWLYQGGITHIESDIERYRELNRARTDFFADIPFHARRLLHGCNGRRVYPASTGIGTQGHGLVATCMALQTEREDVELLPLENPLQTSSFDYPELYSPKTPKFSRAMALRIGDHVTTWVSGTASIVNAESVHLGDVEKQTEQVLTNIERLIAGDNFKRLGWRGAGATLEDLAKVRVYVKHHEDYEKCRAVCERRLGAIPAIYAQADVCRPDLLVEIEGVAFSSLREAKLSTEGTKSSCVPALSSY